MQAGFCRYTSATWWSCCATLLVLQPLQTKVLQIYPLQWNDLNMWPCPSVIIWHSVCWISGALNEHSVWSFEHYLEHETPKKRRGTLKTLNPNFTSTKLSALCWRLEAWSADQKKAILACHPAKSTEWLDCHPRSCELWRIRTGPILFVPMAFCKLLQWTQANTTSSSGVAPSSLSLWIWFY